ncbi:MAG TPA: hypothetical protein VMB75_00795, partial [Rhodocyclaceae bacterium]|nr:hypothetical protein [Rhodocyclaceae bacterium]
VRPPLNWLGWFLAIAWLLPNSQQFLQDYKPVLESTRQPSRWLRWRPHPAWAAAIALMTWIGVVKIGRVSEFLYFQF